MHHWDFPTCAADMCVCPGSDRHVWLVRTQIYAQCVFGVGLTRGSFLRIPFRDSKRRPDPSNAACVGGLCPRAVVSGTVALDLTVGGTGVARATSDPARDHTGDDSDNDHAPAPAPPAADTTQAPVGAGDAAVDDDVFLGAGAEDDDGTTTTTTGAVRAPESDRPVPAPRLRKTSDV